MGSVAQRASPSTLPQVKDAPFSPLRLLSSKPGESTCLSLGLLHEKLEPMEPVIHFRRITGNAGMLEVGPKPLASFSVDAAVSAWIQPHLLYHCPIQGDLMLASAYRSPARLWGSSVPGPHCQANGKYLGTISLMSKIEHLSVFWRKELKSRPRR